MNSGSLDSFQVSTLCGASPNARHTRDTVDCDIPRWAAIDRVDQCVASFGAFSRVSVINTSTSASDTDLGRPGRGSSTSPSRRAPQNRRRQRATVLRATPRRAAISVFEPPSAAASTIRLRVARPAALVRRRAHEANCSRSSSDSSIGTGWGPRAMNPNLQPLHNFRLRTLANRLVGVLHGCLRHQQPYNETTAWPPPAEHAETSAA